MIDDPIVKLPRWRLDTPDQTCGDRERHARLHHVTGHDLGRLQQDNFSRLQEFEYSEELDGPNALKRIDGRASAPFYRFGVRTPTHARRQDCWQHVWRGGRNHLIQQKYKAPLIINDGANIARRIVLQDEIADLAAQSIIEVQ